MKLHKPINFIIPLVVYPFTVVVFINTDNDDVEKILTERQINYTDVNVRQGSDTRRGRTIIFKDNNVLIRMFEFKRNPSGYGYLAHEIFHAVEFVMERIGMKLSNKSNEAYTYLVQYLTKEIYKKLQS